MSKKYPHDYEIILLQNIEVDKESLKKLKKEKELYVYQSSIQGE